MRRRLRGRAKPCEVFTAGRTGPRLCERTGGTIVTDNLFSRSPARDDSPFMDPDGQPSPQAHNVCSFHRDRPDLWAWTPEQALALKAVRIEWKEEERLAARGETHGLNPCGLCNGRGSIGEFKFMEIPESSARGTAARHAGVFAELTCPRCKGTCEEPENDVEGEVDAEIQV